jgi:hypothetical protein
LPKNRGNFTIDLLPVRRRRQDRIGPVEKAAFSADC